MESQVLERVRALGKHFFLSFFKDDFRHLTSWLTLLQYSKHIPHMGRHGPRIRKLTQRHDRCGWHSSADQGQSLGLDDGWWWRCEYGGEFDEGQGVGE
jgi:hypothetical protein